jgi:hypothetical protein
MTDLSVFGEERTATFIDASELDDHINHVYGKGFCFEAENERAYEALQDYDVTTYLDNDQEADLEAYQNNESHNANDITGILLNDMCRQDIIEEGYYVIVHRGH